MKALKIIKAIAKGILTVVRWLTDGKKDKNNEKEQ